MTKKWKMIGFTCFLIVSFAACDNVELNGKQMTNSDVPADPLMASLFPAELEKVTSIANFDASSNVAKPPYPWSPTFYQSLPDGLLAVNLTQPDALPTFAVIGDGMGALGFQMCDIEHYLDHDNHTLPPCAPRAGWASKVAAEYNDKVWMVHHMIRSAINANAVTLPMLINQFKNDTSDLKLVIFTMGSKYTNLGYNFTEHMTNMTNQLLSRGVKVVLMARPPVNTEAPAPLWFNNYNVTACAELAEAVRSVAQQTGVPCLDAWNLFLGLGPRWKEALGPDGVHYSPLGQELMHQELMRILHSELRELSPGRLLNPSRVGRRRP